MHRIGLTIAFGLGLVCSSTITLSNAYRPFVLGILALGIFIVCVGLVLGAKDWLSSYHHVSKAWRIVIQFAIVAIGIGLFFVVAVGFPPINNLQQSARVTVTRFALEPVAPNDKTSDYFIKVYIMNRGPGVGYAPLVMIQTFVSDTTVQNSDLLKRLNKVLLAPSDKPSKDEQMEVNQEEWVPMNGINIKSSDYVDITNVTKQLYVFIVLRYFDLYTKNDDYWITEYCGTPTNNMNSIRVCEQKTYLHTQ